MSGWSLLLSDLLSMIATNLTLLSDLTRFASVCRSWRVVARTLVTTIPPQSPWLLLSAADDSDANRLEYFVPAENKTYRFPLPGSRNHRCIPLNRGFWTLALDNYSDLSLVNPFSRDQIPLPSLPSSQSFTSNIAALSSDPSTSDDWTLIVCLASARIFAICDRGDQRWKILEFGDPITSIAHHDGRFYLVSVALEVFALDYSTFPPTIDDSSKVRLPCSMFGQVELKLVELDGDLLLAQRVVNPINVVSVLFKLVDLGDGDRPGWSLSYSNSQDRVIFFSPRGHSLAIRADDCSGYKPICMYYPDPVYSPDELTAGVTDHFIGECSFKERGIRKIPYLVGGTRREWKLASWVQPIPRLNVRNEEVGASSLAVDSGQGQQSTQ